MGRGADTKATPEAIVRGVGILRFADNGKTVPTPTEFETKHWDSFQAADRARVRLIGCFASGFRAHRSLVVGMEYGPWCGANESDLRKKLQAVGERVGASEIELREVDRFDKDPAPAAQPEKEDRDWTPGELQTSLDFYLRHGCVGNGACEPLAAQLDRSVGSISARLRNWRALDNRDPRHGLDAVTSNKLAIAVWNATTQTKLGRDLGLQQQIATSRRGVERR